MCELLKAQNKTSGSVMIESSVAGIQSLVDRDTGFKQGLANNCPQVKVVAAALQQQRHQHRGVSRSTTR